MSTILALEKISKRFGAVVVADGIDLSLADGEALGIIGPNGAGKTTLFGIITGTVAPDSGRVLFDGRDITRETPERRCRMGIARSFQIPQPFGGMTVFENLVVAAAFGGGKRERDVYGRCAELLERCGLADKANRQAARSRCSIASGWSLRARLPRSRGCCCSTRSPAGWSSTRPPALVELVKEVRASGVSIIWIEHIVHALIAAVDRLVVLHGGALIAEGEPAEVIRRPQVAEIYMGIAADA